MKRKSKRNKQKERKGSPSSFEDSNGRSSDMKDYTKRQKYCEVEYRGTSQYRCTGEDDKRKRQQLSPSSPSKSRDNLSQGTGRTYKKAVFRLKMATQSHRGKDRGEKAEEGHSRSGSNKIEGDASQLAGGSERSCQKASVARPRLSEQAREERWRLIQRHSSGPSSSDKVCITKSSTWRESHVEVDRRSSHAQGKMADDFRRLPPWQQATGIRTVAVPGADLSTSRSAFRGQREPVSRPELSARSWGEKPRSEPRECVSFKITKKINMECDGSITRKPLLAKDEKGGVKPMLGARVLEESTCKGSTGAKYEANQGHKASRSPRGGLKRALSDTGDVPKPVQAGLNETHDISPQATRVCKSDQESRLAKEFFQARSQKQLQVNVEESYGELTAMDIDSSEEPTTSSFTGKEDLQQLIIVLDTNILLNYLDFVKKMRSHGLGALGFPIILIPWVVMQELDALKNGKLSKDVARLAAPAVNFICTSLKKQEPRLWGQSMQQAAKAANALNAENNDDRVLQCCLQYKDLYPGAKLILCTDDKNLFSKAIISQVQALNKEDLVAEVEQLKLGTQAGGYLSPRVPQPGIKAKDGDFQTESYATAAEARELSTGIAILEDALQGALSQVLMKEMKTAFGDIWEDIVLVKPPWTLSDLLLCYKKHWIAVFGNVFHRKLLHTVESLNDTLCKGRTPDTHSLHRAAQEAREVLQEFGRRSDYDGHITQALFVLEPLLQESRQPEAVTLVSVNDDAVMAEAEDLPEAWPSYPEVWAVFDNIWSNICHTSFALFTALDSETPTPESRQCPPEGAVSRLLMLRDTIQQLLHAFHGVLSSNYAFEHVQSLFTFICSSKIASVNPGVTANDFFQCLSQEEYRMKLHMGWNQLVGVLQKLEGFASAVGCGSVGSSWS